MQTFNAPLVEEGLALYMDYTYRDVGSCPVCKNSGIIVLEGVRLTCRYCESYKSREKYNILRVLRLNSISYHPKLGDAAGDCYYTASASLPASRAILGNSSNMLPVCLESFNKLLEAPEPLLQADLGLLRGVDHHEAVEMSISDMETAIEEYVNAQQENRNGVEKCT